MSHNSTNTKPLQRPKWVARRVKELETFTRDYYNHDPKDQSSWAHMSRIKQALTASGVDVISMNVAVSYHHTSEKIKQAAKDALDQNQTFYEDDRGYAGLRQAIAEKMKRYNRLDVDPDQIIITNGSTQACSIAEMATLEAGDAVLHHDPGFTSNYQALRLIDAVPVAVPLHEETDNRIIEEDWRNKITPKTKALWLINPNNPGGRVFTRKELEILADIAIENDLLVYSDEVYDLMVYSPHRHTSIASLPDMAERTITTNSFSKIYAMPGWRLGYVISPTVEFSTHLLRILTNTTHCLNTFIQRGAEVAVREVTRHGPDLSEETKLRDAMYKRLMEIDDVTCLEPEGGSNCFPNLTNIFKSSTECVQYLLEEAHVYTAAGNHSGKQGEGHVRMVFGANPLERTEEAMNRIQEALRKRSHNPN
jgi:aspartate aminotransferase